MVVTAEPVRASRGPGTHLGARTRATPVRLRLVAVELVVLTLLMGLVAGLAANDRHASSAAAWHSAEPLLVDAQAIDTSLSDADTTAGGSFLQGRLEPAALQARYMSDLSQASASLATASQQAGTDPTVTTSIATLAEDVPMYTSLVSTATFNERQGFYPLAAAYLAEANNLMRARILPAAARLYAVEVAQLAGDEGHAVAAWPVVVSGLLLMVLLGSLIAVQRWLSRHFRRTLNVPLAVATVIVIVLGLWFLVAVLSQGSGVDRASADGSGPVALYTQARIRALEMRGDDELTLLTRDSVAEYQEDYSTAAAHLQRALAVAATGAGPAEHAQLTRIAGAFHAYGATHARIRRLDTSGDLGGAVALASGTGPTDLPAVSERLDAVLADGIGSSQQAFDDAMSGATGDIAALLWAIAVFSVLAAALVLIGIEPRMAEYR